MIYMIYIYKQHRPHNKPICLEGFMENHLIFRWPKPLLLMVLGVHGNLMVNTCIYIYIFTYIWLIFVYGTCR